MYSFPARLAGGRARLGSEPAWLPGGADDRGGHRRDLTRTPHSGVLDSQPAGDQSPSGSVVCPTSIM
jgi:hypothetical protein